MKFITITFLLLSSQFAFSQSSFHKQFEIERAMDGSIISVKSKNIKEKKFSVIKYVKFLKSKLEKEQVLLRQSFHSSRREGYIRHSILNEITGSSQYNIFQDEKIYLDGLDELRTIDIERIFNNPKFKKFINTFESKINEKLAILNLSIISKPDSPSFFITQKRVYEAVNWAIKLAKKTFNDIPILNTIIQIIQNSEHKIRTLRVYYQNSLMHYLENYSAQDLGLTDHEVNHIMSSLYESKRPWYNFWDKDHLKNTWDEYGFKNFYMTFRAGTKKLKSYSQNYDSVLTRINFAFQEVEIGGEKVILNLINSKNLFDFSPSVAFNYDHPSKISETRLFLELLQLGISQIPALPSWGKNIFSQYLQSYYKQQSLTEGALAAYFLENKQFEDHETVMSQSVNPYFY